MSLYAIGDFHLSFTVNKPMDVFDKRWKNHVVKIEKYWKKRVTENDTVVITGDHSWGRDLAECQADLDFIMALPGRKILLRGNHDMFWDAGRTKRLNEKYNGRLFFLQNNFYSYGNTALVGTKGYCYEGKDSSEHFEKAGKSGSWSACGCPMSWLWQQAIPLLSVFFTIRLPVLEKRKAVLPGWRWNMGQIR